MFRVLKFDVVGAQRRFLAQHELIIQRAHVAQGHSLQVQLFALRVVDANLNCLDLMGQAVACIVVGAEDSLIVYGLAGPVDGPVGIDVALVTGPPELGLYAKIPGANPLLPAIVGHPKVRLPRLTGDGEKVLPEVVEGQIIAQKDAVDAGLTAGG